MVRGMWGVTGDVDVEVLPCNPAVPEGADEKGRELLAGLRDWVGWVGRKTDRLSIWNSSMTGGVEREKEVSGTIHYKPTFLTQGEKGRRLEGAGTEGEGAGAVLEFFIEVVDH